MGWEAAPGGASGGSGGSCSPLPSAGATSCSTNGKRSRDPAEDEVYLDNFHSHKRYLSEVFPDTTPLSLFKSYILLPRLFDLLLWVS